MRLRYLYAVGAVVLLLGVAIVGVGLTTPEECTADYAIDVNRSVTENRTVVEAGNLSEPVQQAVQTVVEENRTAFVEPEQYRGELANRTVQYEGELYPIEGTEVLNCAGGRDDLYILVGFWIAVFGTVVLSLVGLYDYGKDRLRTDADYR
ncbi:hypothetical protein [Haloarchaeobius amylolyticus]|uniref:hypothetical protein n=1 Tax=Haloarchaeobius amylolyticus TaxID=1198296 RepID=UPI00226DEE3A|nr:hypothetical protein [Haloarchaeobius amylolyticus]